MHRQETVKHAAVWNGVQPMLLL